MIFLNQNEDDYNNDLRAMLMAFFPGEKIVADEASLEKIRAHKDDYNINTELLFGLEARYEADKTVLSINDNCSTEIAGDYRDRRVFRNQLKLASYKLLSQLTGRALPWGDLTGVRPTKIAMKLFPTADTKVENDFYGGVGHKPSEQINTNDEIYSRIVDYYIDTYAASRKKAELAVRVAANELNLVRDIALADSYCLYIGIPFCPSRCLYCSFTAYAIDAYEGYVDAYIDRLCEEISYVADRYRDKKLVAIYIGGGTPTSIDATRLDRLLTHIESLYDTAAVEYTIEAGRPDSITRDKLRCMRAHHVSRISINPQTMNDETLRTIGRAHNAFQVEEAFAMAREEGFDNINMDLIAGLPGEDAEKMRHTLDRIKAMRPDSLTIHSLAIKRAANLRIKMDEYRSDINHDTEEMLDMVAHAADELGMQPYYLYRQKNIGGNLENVGYALPHKECLYNILIMEELTDIIAVGAGSSSKYVIRDESGHTTRIDRSENCKSIHDYIERFDDMVNRKK